VHILSKKAIVVVVVENAIRKLRKKQR